MKPRAIKSKMIKVEAQTLRIHPTAQRELRPARLKYLTENMDLDSVDVFHAVEYSINGETAIWIVDGQHRWRALMDLGLGEWVVEVKIHLEDKDDASASKLFLRLNNRLSVHPFDKFDQARKAGFEEAVQITKIVERHQLKIGRQCSNTSMTCVTALNTVYNYDHGKILTTTLDTLVQAWGRIANALEGKLIEGLGIVYKTFNGSVEQPVLIKKLSKYPGGASGLIGDAKGIRQYRHASISQCVAIRIVEVYNLGRRAGKLEPPL